MEFKIQLIKSTFKDITIELNRNLLFMLPFLGFFTVFNLIENFTVLGLSLLIILLLAYLLLLFTKNIILTVSSTKKTSLKVASLSFVKRNIILIGIKNIRQILYLLARLGNLVGAVCCNFNELVLFCIQNLFNNLCFKNFNPIMQF